MFNPEICDCDLAPYQSHVENAEHAEMFHDSSEEKMENYFYTIEDDFLDFYDSVEYSDSLDSPCSNESDQENIPSNHFEFPKRRGKAPVKKVQQRKAANMRERRRMKSINEAFDSLRSSIPFSGNADRRLSKVDTLKLAMRYITYLSDVIQATNDFSNNNQLCKADREPEKVIVRCQFSDVEAGDMDSHALLGHSLSWADDKLPKRTPDNKLTAKLWVPENASDADLVNLSSYTTDFCQ